MLIGVPKEVKNHEYRVGMIPASVAELTRQNHSVVVETGAGVGSGFADDDYRGVGAKIVNSADEIFSQVEIIIKVKEPQPQERKLLKKDQLLFTYLHLAPDKEQTEDLLTSGAICIAYETISSPDGKLPLLAPMSEVAGRLSIQAGAHNLEKHNQGRGILLGGVAGSGRGTVVIIGGGIVGVNAAMIAVGMGAHTIIIDNNLEALRRIESQFGSQAETIFSNTANIEHYITQADLLIGGVLIPGAVAPKLITGAMIKKMKSGSVVVDVAIDQGGCLETSRLTTHSEPTFIVDEVVHYCVANMPSMVARTSAIALNNATLPFIVKLANQGYVAALKSDPYFAAGLNVHKGKITHKAVAQSQNLPYHSSSSVLV